jgi:hypothetical protein
VSTCRDQPKMASNSVKNRVRMFEQTTPKSDAGSGIQIGRRSIGGTSDAGSGIQMGRHSAGGKDHGFAIKQSRTASEVSRGQAVPRFGSRDSSVAGSNWGNGALDWPHEDDDISREIANVPTVTSRPKSFAQNQKPIGWAPHQKVSSPRGYGDQAATNKSSPFIQRQGQVDNGSAIKSSSPFKLLKTNDPKALHRQGDRAPNKSSPGRVVIPNTSSPGRVVITNKSSPGRVGVVNKSSPVKSLINNDLRPAQGQNNRGQTIKSLPFKPALHQDRILPDAKATTIEVKQRPSKIRSERRDDGENEAPSFIRSLAPSGLESDRVPRLDKSILPKWSLSPTNSTETRSSVASTGHLKASTSNELHLNESALRHNLDAASVIMEEEKSNSGSSNASTRSSLSNKELSSIAQRAMTLSKNSESTRTSSMHNTIVKEMLRESSTETVDPSEEKHLDSKTPLPTTKTELSLDLPNSKTDVREGVLETTGHGLLISEALYSTPSGRRNRSISGISHQEARKALLVAAMKKKEKKEGVKSEELKLNTIADPHSHAVQEQTYLNLATVIVGNANVSKNESKALPKVNSIPTESTAPVVNDSTASNNGIHTPFPPLPESTLDGPSSRLGSRASRVLALKNSTKSNVDGEQHFDDISIAASCASFDSKARRLQHPALAARRPKTPAPSSPKPFSEDIFLGLRQFNAARNPANASPGTKDCSSDYCSA